eukprot:6178793-Pleurochrysis_carterae.AAC.2
MKADMRAEIRSGRQRRRLRARALVSLRRVPRAILVRGVLCEAPIVSDRAQCERQRPKGWQRPWTRHSHAHERSTSHKPGRAVSY